MWSLLPRHLHTYYTMEELHAHAVALVNVASGGSEFAAIEDS
jgi:hypothetical protein